MNSFIDDVLLLIYSVIYHIMNGVNSIFFPDGWIKYITIPLVILSLTYYFITSFELDEENSYIEQLFQTFIMVFFVYFAIGGFSLSIKGIMNETIDRKEIALQLEDPLIKKEIIINGKKLEDNSFKFINSFTQIRDNTKQGSYAFGERINIKIKLAKKVLKFQLEEDSKIPNDYWVFFFKEEKNKYYYIGHIKTALLKNYHQKITNEK